ncbi:MAG: sugar nucleotide-binding protein, partial [Planctomycetales bacterium]|nr:sugar nucleotide-binding protein [Planctomycetales bacterium]
RRSVRPSHRDVRWRWLDADLTSRASIAGDPCEARWTSRASIAGDPCEARWTSRDSIAGDLCEARWAGPGLGVDACLEIAPAAIIHCAAQANANEVERQPTRSARINVDVPRRLARAAARHGIRFIHVSTDLVFDGAAAPYAEDAVTCPLSEYGRQKEAAERAVLASGGVVCRLPLLLGAKPCDSDPPHPQWQPAGALEWMLRSCETGASLFVDEHRSPLTTLTAARGLLLAVEHGSGVWHLAGERISRWDLGLLVASVWNRAPDKLERVRHQDLQLAAPRPADVTLTSAVATAAGFHAAGLREQLEELKTLRVSSPDR